MLPKIEVGLAERRVSVRYPEENDSDRRGDDLRNLKVKWSSILLDFLVEIVQNVAAVAYVYSSDGDFSFPDGLKAKTWTQKTNGIGYFFAASNARTAADVIELASLMEFELSTLWFQLGSTIDGSNVDPVEFFRSVNKIVTGEEKGHSTLQCLGSIEDGNKVIWDNPNRSQVDHALSQLPTLCSQNGFSCQVEDRRNKI